MVRGSKLDYGVTPEGSTVSRTAFLFPLEDTRDPLLQESEDIAPYLLLRGIPRLGRRTASLGMTDTAQRRRHLTEYRMSRTF